MPMHSIGITATELFACNPYRILGVAVNETQSKISETYERILKLAEAGAADKYTSPFDFDSLPPFSRTADSLKTAYTKLASTGYRCFAYSDSEFTVALNIDDVALNLRDITCYDCFLRCYMWLVVNDRQMDETELWVQLAKYIDKLITSTPDKWTKLFDHRFPDEMLDDDLTVYRSFYTTFCEIILLPLKEMVKGSMKCQTASEILKIKGINTDQQFPYIEIPQANAPKPGEPAPLLKIALKDGDEFFDISTGEMHSFSSENSADVESHVFAEAATSITAAEIVDEPEETAEETTEAYSEPAEAEAYTEAEQADEYTQPAEEITRPAEEYTQSAEPEIPEEEPVQTVEVSEPETAAPPVMAAPPIAEEKPVNEVKTAPSLRKPKPKTVSFNAQEQPAKQEASFADMASAAQPSYITGNAEKAAEAAKVASEEKKVTVAPQLRKKNAPPAEPKQVTTAPKLNKRKEVIPPKVEEVPQPVEQPADPENTEEGEEEPNLYTDALIKMLRSNRSRNQTMKGVDTRHVYNGGDAMEVKKTNELSMEDINMKKYDSSLLASPYGESNPNRVLTREEQFRDIKIDDMLNPTLGSKTTRSTFEPDPIEQFKKKKEEQKASRKKLAKLTAVLAVIIIAYFALKILEII